MKKLKFNKTKYGKELLIDIIDMSQVDNKIKSIQPNFYIIGCLKSSSGTIDIHEDTINLSDNSIIFVPPGESINIKKSKFKEAFWVIFEGEFLDFFFNDKFFTYKFDYFHGTDSKKILNLEKSKFDYIYNLATELHDEIHCQQSDSEHLLRSWLYLMLIKLNRNYKENFKTQGNVISDQYLLKFKYLLENNIRDYQTVGEFASAIGVSKTHLNKLSNLFFGRTCKQMINERIILEAKKSILYTNQTISEISHSLNFSDPANFNRFFKKATNQTPALFRSQFSK